MHAKPSFFGGIDFFQFDLEVQKSLFVLYIHHLFSKKEGVEI